jgi:hypothetical protein
MTYNKLEILQTRNMETEFTHTPRTEECRQAYLNRPLESGHDMLIWQLAVTLELENIRMREALQKHTDSSPQLVERLYDETGRLLWEKPYPFRCLFVEGQEMIVESIPMTILSCSIDGNIVTTHVKLHKPWPNIQTEVPAESGPSNPVNTHE